MGPYKINQAVIIIVIFYYKYPVVYMDEIKGGP